MTPDNDIAAALERCPFCPDGGEPKMFNGEGWSSHPFQVVCVGKHGGRESCNAKRWPSYTREEAIAAWNSRSVTVNAGMLEALKNVALPSVSGNAADFYTRFYTWYESECKPAISNAEAALTDRGR